MTVTTLTRRSLILGTMASLGGCTALSSLNDAATPLDSFALSHAGGSTQGRRSAATVLVARPSASAALASDRILVRTGPAAISYLPDARWSDEAPEMIQSLLIRSISETGRIGYVGPSEGGPVPDYALLGRLDAFELLAGEGVAPGVRVTLALSLLNDRNQRVLRSRTFDQAAPSADDSAPAVVAAFQAALNVMLPQMADWTLAAV